MHANMTSQCTLSVPFKKKNFERIMEGALKKDTTAQSFSIASF